MTVNMAMIMTIHAGRLLHVGNPGPGLWVRGSRCREEHGAPIFERIRLRKVCEEECQRWDFEFEFRSTCLVNFPIWKLTTFGISSSCLRWKG